MKSLNSAPDPRRPTLCFYFFPGPFIIFDQKTLGAEVPKLTPRWCGASRFFEKSWWGRLTFAWWGGLKSLGCFGPCIQYRGPDLMLEMLQSRVYCSCFIGKCCTSGVDRGALFAPYLCRQWRIWGGDVGQKTVNFFELSAGKFCFHHSRSTCISSDEVQWLHPLYFYRLWSTFLDSMRSRLSKFVGLVSATLLVCRQCSSLLKSTATTSFSKSAGRLLVPLKVSWGRTFGLRLHVSWVALRVLQMLKWCWRPAMFDLRAWLWSNGTRSRLYSHFFAALDSVWLHISFCNLSLESAIHKTLRTQESYTIYDDVIHNHNTVALAGSSAASNSSITFSRTTRPSLRESITFQAKRWVCSLLGSRRCCSSSRSCSGRCCKEVLLQSILSAARDPSTMLAWVYQG